MKPVWNSFSVLKNLLFLLAKNSCHVKVQPSTVGFKRTNEAPVRASSGTFSSQNIPRRQQAGLHCHGQAVVEERDALRTVLSVDEPDDPLNTLLVGFLEYSRG